MKRKAEKLTCPACGSAFSRVLPRKVSQTDDTYRRHRQCDDCGCEYETLEQIGHIIKRTAA